MSESHPDSAAIDRIGTRHITKHFGMTRQAVSYWRKNGVPRQYRKFLRELGEQLGKPVPEMNKMRDRQQ